MNNETQNIFASQLKKLPHELVSFLADTNWEETLAGVSTTFSLSKEDASDFEREVIFVLAGLTHPNLLPETLEKEAGLNKEIISPIVREVEEKIFAPIRPLLLSYFESEALVDTSLEPKTPVSTIITDTPPIKIPRKADVAPDNLPTGEETEPLLPPIPPKNRVSAEETPQHPFEEKMKKVFVAGQQSMGELSIEPPTPQAPTPPAPSRPSFADPYREPIE